MLKLKNLSNNITFTQDVSGIVTALQEISVLEMQKIRDRVLYTRHYMNGLLDIFIDVRIDYERIVAKEKKSLQSPSRKTALVILSQNARFSDSNIGQVFQSFIKDLPSFPNAHIIVVGEVAKQLMTEHQIEKKHTVSSIDLPDHVTHQNHLAELFVTLQEYQEVILYFGTFKNLLQQESKTQELSGHDILLQAQTSTDHTRSQFLYEPKIAAIIKYFEQEVKRSLLLQASNESRLAHLGSRIQTLEQSRTTIAEKLTKLTIDYSRARRQASAKKQLQRLAGRQLWN